MVVITCLSNHRRVMIMALKHVYVGFSRLFKEAWGFQIFSVSRKWEQISVKLSSFCSFKPLAHLSILCICLPHLFNHSFSHIHFDTDLKSLDYKVRRGCSFMGRAYLACTRLWVQSAGLFCWAWWCVPVISALGRREQEDQKFKITLGYVANSRLFWNK